MAITKYEICGYDDISHHSYGAYSCNNFGYGVPGIHGGGYADKIWYFCRMKYSELKNLGYANGWKETPEIVQQCIHTMNENTIGRCLTEYACHECGFRYQVDSGD